MKRILVVLFAVILLASTIGVQAVAADSTCGATYTVQRGDYLVKIANKCGTTASAISAANPSIKNPNLIFPGQVLTMPKEGTNISITGGSIYIVKPGDTLAGIASLFKVFRSDILKANPSITNANLIFAGQQIKLPEGAAQVLTAGVTPVNAKPSDVVKLGVTGFDAGLSVEIRFGLSNDSTDVIGNATTDSHGGVLQNVTIPANAQANKSYVFVVRIASSGKQAVSNALTIGGTSTTTNEYTVVRGDTLRKIANRFNTTVAAIMAANASIKDPNLIFPGQVLKITSGQSGAAAAITPLTGAAGTKIILVADGFPANQNVDIDFGVQGKTPTVVKDGKTDSAGYLRLELTLPTSAVVGEKWVVTVHTTDLARTISASSAVFTVK